MYEAYGVWCERNGLRPKDPHGFWMDLESPRVIYKKELDDGIGFMVGVELNADKNVTPIAISSKLLALGK